MREIAEAKKNAIEQIDKLIVGPVYEAMNKYPTWRILVLPDHPTPVKTGAQCGDPVPFAMAGNDVSGAFQAAFTESNAAKSGLHIDKGYELMGYFLKS